MFLNKIKKRCGISESITVYDSEIMDYIEDGKQDMIASGVPENLVQSDNRSVLTALTFYVKANIGNDRTDTDKYMDLYRKKVFRLTLED